MSSENEKIADRAALLDKLEEISSILETGLDRQTIAIIKDLCDQGVNPQALAQIIKYLRRERADSS